MVHNQTIKGKHDHRAVAPIIATLLMVAIAVVGGILIFVFTQGFFSDTELTTTPTADSLEVFGYDTREKVALLAHDGTSLTVNVALATANLNKLTDDETFLVYVRNSGSKALSITTVEVFGEPYEVAATLEACTTTVPAKGKFLLAGDQADADGSNAIALADCLSAPTLQAGEEGTLFIAYDDEANGEIKIGRPISIVIKTSNGGTFHKQLTMGLLS